MILVSLMSFFAYAQLPEYQFEEAWTGSPGAPPNWIVINEFGPLYTWARTEPGNPAQPPFGGTGYSAFLKREEVAPTDAIPRDWLVTRAFPMVNSAELKFQTRLSTNGPQGSIFRIYIAKDTGNPADMTVSKFVNEGVLIQSFTEAEMVPGTQTTWTEKTLAVPGNALWPAGTNVRIAFVMEGNDGDQWFIDNVKVTGLCIAPTNVTVSTTTPPTGTTATFTWNDAAGSNKWEVEIVPENVTPLLTGVVVDGPLPYTKTGLQACTRYKIFVRSICSDGGKSAWTNVLFFNTSCPGQTCDNPKIIPPANSYSSTDNTANYANFYNATVATGCNTTGNYLGGNDVVYSYTPGTTGNYNIEIRNAATTAGVFVYSSCASIGTACLNGAVVTSATAGVAKIASFALTAGTTYYIVVSSTAGTPSTPYNLIIQQVFCNEPTLGTASGITGTSATLGWTKATTSINSWQVYVQNVGLGLPTAAGSPVTGLPTYNATALNTGGALQPSTTYEFYVREVCAGGATNSVWAGPFLFTTSQIPTGMPYIQNFENGLNGMTTTNGNQVNKWKVGTEPANGITSNSAFITNNDINNVYTMNLAVATHLYRDVIMPPAVGQLSLSFDWRTFGESIYDYIKVWVVPTSFTPQPGVPITAADGTAVGLVRYNLSLTWQNELVIFTAPTTWAGSNRRLVFEWINDTSQGANPAGAIDNINFAVVTCPQPPSLTLDSLVLNQAVVKWTEPGIIPASYDVFVTQNPTQVPNAATVPTYNEVPGLTQAITPLTPSQSYYVYVRAHCSATDKSFWTGPLYFAAPQVPANMDYTQNFDTAVPHEFTLNNTTKTNRWIVGTATNNSAPNSLYISDNNGTTNTYTNTSAAVVHAYRDITMPPTIPSGQVNVKFDWKSGGEGTGTAPADRLRVWVVNTSYSPVVDTEITTANGVLIGNYNLSNDAWVNVNAILDASTWNGTTKRFVFEWRNDAFGGNGIGAAVDNISIKVVTCPAPTALTLASSAPGSASFTWTAPAGSIVPANYDYYFSTSTTPPTDATAPTGTGLTGTAGTISGFGEGLNYSVWIRSNCGSGGTSVWVGPVNFLSPQTPATINYTQNFDSADHKWAQSNGNQVNKWIVGSATNNSAPNSLYISNNGAANTYTVTSASVVHAYRDVLVPTNIDQLLLQYDWKGVGEINDYFRVWLIPVNVSPVPGTPITPTNSNGGIPVGGNFTGSTTWKQQQSIIEAANFAGQVKRLVFEWRNNAATGDQSPAAIDNIKLIVVKCPQPLALAMTSNTGAGTTFTWSAPASGAPASYDYYLTTSPTPPTDDTVATGSTTANTVTLTLPNSTNYFFYVRSNCGGDGASIWTGPINFNTPQVPVAMPYFQDFEGASHGFALSSGAQADKWFYGTATSSSATHSLYISKDGGVTNTYTNTLANVSHVYRDIIVPAGVTQLDIAFDWRAAGEGTLDYLRAWFVPATFEPVPGTQILPANGGVAIGANFNQQANWQHAEAIITLPAALQGVNGRIVFEWKTNNSGGAQPAGAIDNVDVRAFTCPKPTGLSVNQIGMTNARINWTEAGTAAQWEVYVVPTGSPIPNSATVGDITSDRPYTKTGLLAATTYQYYVRAICGPNDKSRWTGPLQFTTNVCEVVDQCPINFILTDSGSNGWGSTTMTVRQGGLVVGTLGPQLAAGAGPVTVTFQLCKGLPYEVFFNPGGTSPAQSGLEIVNPFNGQTVFRRVGGTLNSDQNTILYTGISFCSAITCPQPVRLESKNVVNAPNTTQLSWTPVGTETQWEVVAQVQGAGFPAAPGSNPTIVVVNDTQYVLGGLTPSVPYEFYVRAVCGPDNKSFWSGPLKYSIYTPPACADVTVVDDDLEIIAPDTEFVVCPGEPLCVDFSANFYQGAAETTSYAVESIPFLPPFPTLGGTSLPVGEDDIWSPKVDLPFEFCFYGNVYNSAQIGANGLLSFNVVNASGGPSGYVFTQQVPSTAFPQLNAIYGVYQDTDPRPTLNNWDNPSINYQVLGNYPCRALVVSFNELAQFGCSTDSAEHQAVGAQSSQIVIYEVTNIIEVYVKRRVPCNNHQDGRGLIGIQNATGSAGVVPPGRNTGNWSALTPEAWRFTPNGDPTVVFEWLKDSNFYSSDRDINVCSTGAGTTVMTARATYNLCNGETVVRESNFNLTVTEQIVPEVDPINITKCGNGGDITVTLTDAVAELFADPTGYNITFYTTEQNAIDDVNDIPAQFTTATTATIWVRVSKGTQPCFITRSFQVIVSNQGPQFTITPSTSICEGTSTPIAVTPGDFNEADATYVWTLDGAPLPDTTSSITAAAAGVYKVVVTKNECEGTGTSTVTVVPLPVADTHADVEECDTYTLPALSANNSYYTAAGGPTGTGTLMDPATPVTATQTVYVYAVSPVLAACTDESSFIVTINQRPTIETNTEDVFTCGSYTLPAPTGNEVYYTAAGGPNGTGTVVDIATPIGLGTYVIYVYEESGTNCFAEASFTIKVSETPVAATLPDVARCDVYVLPSVGFGNEYHTLPGGAGDVLPVGANINTTQTIYIYAVATGNPNCFDESEFNVTITPTPSFNLGGPYLVCQPSNAVITVNNANFTDADGVTYTWTLGGNVVGNTSSLTAAEFGSYTLTVTRGDCESSQTVDVTLNNTAFDLVFMDGCDGNSYGLEVTDKDGSFNIDNATYVWTGPATATGPFTSTDRKIFPKVTGDYTVTVTTADGCVSEETFPVISTTCDIPRGVSPNGDTKNDTFDLTSLGVKKLAIFNRYGQEVYSRNNYTNEWAGQGSNGDELPTGTYFYMIERTNGESKTGWVYLNREDK